MRRGTSSRVEDCSRRRADTQGTTSPAGSPESRALTGRGLQRTVLMWLAGVLTGRATRPRPRYPRTVSTAFEGPASTRLGQFFGPAADQHPGLSGFSLLDHGREAFIVRLALADLAERSLDMQVLRLGWRYDWPDHRRPRDEGGRSRGQGAPACRRSLQQGQRSCYRRPRCPPRCRDPSVQPAHQPELVHPRLHSRLPQGQPPHAQQVDGCRQCGGNRRRPQYRRHLLRREHHRQLSRSGCVRGRACRPRSVAGVRPILE